MSLFAQTREWRRLALTLGGEGMQSGLHFALNVALIALLPAREYGTFAFTLVLGGVGLVYMRALTALPASTFIGRAPSRASADFLEGAFGAPALVISLGAGLVAGIVLAFSGGEGALPGAAVVALWSLRSHLRTVGFARGQPGAVTLSDAAFAFCGALASWAAFALDADRLQAVLLALVFANAAGIVALSLARRCAPRLDFRRRARRFYLRLARRLLWSLFGVTTTILQGQGVAFLVVGVAGTQGYAPIAAMLNLFAPLRILAMSLANMLQPEISRLAAAGDEAGWRRLRRVWTLRAAIIALAYGDAGFLVIPHLHLRSVQGQPVMLVAAFAWALYAMVLAYLMPRILLETRMRYREVAFLSTMGALVTLAATALILRFSSPPYAILGGLMGETLAAVATWRLTWRMELGPSRPASARAPLAKRSTP